MKRVYPVILLLATAGLLMAAGNVQSGQAVYTKTCKVCHGPQGEGNPAIAKALKVTIPNLGSQQVQALSADDLKKLITEGKGQMKPVKTVSGGEIADVVSYVRTLAKK